MNTFLSLGRWFFAIPFALLGLVHFMDVDIMTTSVPEFLPAKWIFVYLTGLILILASVSMLIGRYDKIAAIGLACFLLLMIGFVYIPNVLDAPNKNMFITGMLKDFALAGAALMYAKHYANER
ncbi:MAG: DoxX family membrane protein [Chitinophagales bacterium]|nr:DoxX family membrane protein [Chitinophagales bacterium]